MSRILLAGGAVAALLASTASAQAAPSSSAAEGPSEQITVGINTINGSGCPSGTAAVAVNADNTAFTVTYSDYLAMAGGGAGAADFRKNCQLNLDINVPSGFTYAIASVDYRGYAYLADGATGMERAGYYFQGSSDTSYSTHEWDGPYDDNWQATDSTEWAELVWAPCGEQRNFNINTELRVYSNGSDSTSLMTMDSTDGAVSTVYHLAWQEC
jgi:hypothetical protein